ncbi:hypothetical protein [Segnochrobactrum spirostomi]|uniref:ArsR family transcriptional regulator n=1 Tax=Segnochrobactrum spirostomi TaxID=2608987 RepID=A0A6A7Y8U7_9HYPH|nr:hypothetical protein [Segnochrobactrum spirostomi]MQT14401.1 hypothetical protein [Segnochrobactrum spirostomi]
MTFTETLARDRRRLILEHLAAAPEHALGMDVLAVMVGESRQAAYRDLVYADIERLADHGLVRIEELPSAIGPQREVRATALGLDVAGGRAHPFVASKLPGY